MRINYINLQKQSKQEEKNLVKLFKSVIKSGQFVGGEFVEKFEKLPIISYVDSLKIIDKKIN